jgi:hypothetical protein
MRVSHTEELQPDQILTLCRAQSVKPPNRGHSRCAYVDDRQQVHWHSVNNRRRLDPPMCPHSARQNHGLKVAMTADQLALVLRTKVPACAPVAVTSLDSVAACEFPAPATFPRRVNRLPAVGVPV